VRIWQKAEIPVLTGQTRAENEDETEDENKNEGGSKDVERTEVREGSTFVLCSALQSLVSSGTYPSSLRI
jgi:hypothetical protein